jgi:hypothetical protein
MDAFFTSSADPPSSAFDDSFCFIPTRNTLQVVSITAYFQLLSPPHHTSMR